LKWNLRQILVQTLFDHVQTIFKGQMDMKEVTLTSEFTTDLPGVRADANKITWVLTNLISNAMRYVGKGGHIQFMARGIGPQVHLSVRDDGPGIPWNINQRYFRNLFR
jgi:two-component system, NtrC family, sensor histidine kinase KinB